ncbi:hypothetical protein [Clostridium sp.]|jgi:hypothetical protein|uniref:hypothetical protein n=1 Tax=Clostridium sp. TaxID=1506 RepID=UPI003FD818B3
MIIKNKNGFEQIFISDKLDKIVENVIKRAKLDKKTYEIKPDLKSLTSTVFK